MGNLSTEKSKAAYRIAYSLFDKVGFLLNSYMSLGILEKQVSFRRRWRAGDGKPIRAEFDVTGNWGFSALYWLAKDLFEAAGNEVAEPQARRLSAIRNHLEHKYLRLTLIDCVNLPHDDLALTISRAEFERMAIHLLKLARSALVYLRIGVGLEERRRERERAGVSIEEIPTPPLIPDDEKI